MALQNDAAKNSSWRTTRVITPRFGCFANTLNKGNNHVPDPSYKRPQGNHPGKNSHGRHGKFEGHDTKGASSSTGLEASLRMRKHTLKVLPILTSMSKVENVREVLLATRTTTRGIRPRANSLPKSSASVVELILT